MDCERSLTLALATLAWPLRILPPMLLWIDSLEIAGRKQDACNARFDISLFVRGDPP